MERIQFALAFDLATQTGWAMGGPGDTAPKSGAVRLRDDDDLAGEAEHNIAALFDDLRRYRQPDLVVWETPMTPEGWFQLCQRQGRPQNGGSLIIQNVLAGVLRENCRARHIPFMEFARSTVLKHFTGRATWSSGKGAGDGGKIGKAMCLKRCIQLRFLPPGAKNFDQSDAIALWDLAVSKYGGRVPASFEFFDEGKMAHQGND